MFLGKVHEMAAEGHLALSMAYDTMLELLAAKEVEIERLKKERDYWSRSFAEQNKTAGMMQEKFQKELAIERKAVQWASENMFVLVRRDCWSDYEKHLTVDEIRQQARENK